MDKAQLFEQYSTHLHEGLWRYILSRVRDYDLACDIHQDVLTQIWKAAGQLRDVSNFERWAIKICKNRVTKAMKKYSIQLSRLSYINDDSEVDYLRNSITESAEDTALTLMQISEAQMYLNSLPAEIRQIVVLHALDGLTFEKIGELLNLPSSTVKSKFFRAKRRFEELNGG